jgi:ankyrin repeat protein
MHTPISFLFFLSSSTYLNPSAMISLHKGLAMLSFFLLSLSIGCRTQSDRPAEVSEENAEKTATQAPLLMPDPVSEEQLRQAAFEGDVAAIKELLQQGVNANAADTENRTALTFAAFNGHSDVIVELLNAGADVNGRDVMGRTILMYCATGPFPEAAAILLDKGADPNLVDSDEHFTALMHAAAEGNLEVVKVLMDHGADPTKVDIDGDDAASFAQQSGHNHVVEYLSSKQ